MFKQVKPASLLFVCVFFFLFVFFRWNSQPKMKMQSLSPHPHCDGRLGGVLLCWMLLQLFRRMQQPRFTVKLKLVNCPFKLLYIWQLQEVVQEKRLYGRQQAHHTYVLGSPE